VQAKRKVSKRAAKPKTPVAPAEKASDQTHRQRFDQLLGDAVLGVTPTKKR
jgi:hypothetical protein